MNAGRLWTSRLVVVGFGLAVGLAFGFFFYRANPASCVDVDGFGQLGATVAQQGDFGGSIRRGPIYPLFLGLIYAGFGVGNHAAVIVGQALLLAWLGLSAQVVARRLGASERMAFWTGVAVVGHPLSWWYVPRLWVELCYALFVLWMVYAAIRAAEKPTWLRLVGFGCWAGLASLCKAPTMLLPVFLGAGIGAGMVLRMRACAHLKWKDWLKWMLVPVAAMALTIMPWTVRNRMVSGRWVPVSSNMGVEFFRGNVFAEQNSHLLRQSIPEIWEVAMERERAVLEARGYPAGVRPDWAELDEIFDPLMKDFMVRSPGTFALKVAKQIPAFWIRGETRGKSTVFVVCALGTLALGAWGGWRSRGRIGPAVIWLTVLYFNLLYAAVLAWARYSMPLYPPLLLLGVPIVVDSIDRWRAGRSAGMFKSVGGRCADPAAPG